MGSSYSKEIYHTKSHKIHICLFFKVTGYALNIRLLFLVACFSLLIHYDTLFHFMVSISADYKYKGLIKTTFKSCGKPIFLEIYHTRNCNI